MLLTVEPSPQPPFLLVERVSCSPGWSQTQCIAEDDLEFLIRVLDKPNFNIQLNHSFESLT